MGRYAVDHERGLVFASTGSASFDFYGGNRHGQNLFANCVLALDAETGIRKWHYQTIHHDMWDRDLPAAPVLVTVTHNGERKDAVAQTTKTGYVFLLNRDTGEPLFPVEEVARANFHSGRRTSLGYTTRTNKTASVFTASVYRGHDQYDYS
ncbi:MAG: hypothetical protein U5K54_21050 [Cytophagales bacterium]|nr:hypothetical protein [Cytophagales bacterium]